MKRNLISFLLVVVMTMGQFSGLGLSGTTSAAERAVGQPVDLYRTCNTASKDASDASTFGTAYVRNYNTSSTGNGTAKKLEVVVNLKATDNNQSIFAMIMKASDYDQKLARGPAKEALASDNYFNFDVQRAYYGIARRLYSQRNDLTLVMPVVDATQDNSNAMSRDEVPANMVKEMAVAAVSGVNDASDNYYVEYKLVVFAEGQTGDRDSQYYVDSFYVDSQGYVCTPSYLLRYNGNNPTVGEGSVSGVPAHQIARADWQASVDTWGTTDTPNIPEIQVTKSKPTRDGYECVGWTTKKDCGFLEEGKTLDALKTAYPREKFYTGSGEEAFVPPGDEDASFEVNKIYDLYAVWQQVNVRFWDDNTNNRHFTGSNTPQVDVNWIKPQETLKKDPGYSNDYEVTVQVGEETKTYPFNGNTTTGEIGFGLSFTKSNSTYAHWSISGMPNADSKGQPVTITLKVTNMANKTEDTTVIRFDEIRKAAQPVPTTDTMTGLQGSVETIPGESGGEDTKDGKLIGFYAPGSPQDGSYDDALSYDQKTGLATVGNTGFFGQALDANKSQGVNGTGAVTKYYLDKGMVYEYCPMNGASIAEDEALPNNGWREVPFPKGWYDPAELALLEGTDETPGSNGMNAKTVTYSTRQADRNAAIKDNTPGEFTGWPDNYGEILFDGNGNPYIHGLEENAQYAIRFRANEVSSASGAVVVTVSGGGAAASTPGTSGGLAVNLAGGTVAEEDQAAYQAFVDAAASLTPGDTLKIPEVEPRRDGYQFLGWTLGEWDDGTNSVKVYKAKEKTETVTVTWLDPEIEGENQQFGEIRTIQKGEADPEHPAAPTHENLVFLKWNRAEDAAGNITFTAVYVPAGNVTYIFVDSAAEEGTEPVRTVLDRQLTSADYPEVTVPEGQILTWVIGDPETETTGEGETDTTITTVTICAEYHTAQETPAEPTDEVTMPSGPPPASLAAVWYANLEPDMSKVRTITFYDWDGTTKLGVVAVQSGYRMASSDYQTFLDGLYDTSVMGIDPSDPYKLAVTDPEKEGYIYNPNYRTEPKLTDKGGYTFSGWVPLDDEFSHYPAAEASAMNDALIDWSTLEVTDHMDVKACYLANSKCGTADGVYYTLEYQEIERSGVFYTIRIDIHRYYVSTSNAFPKRMQEPILKTQVTVPGSTQPISLYTYLDNKDYTSATFTFPNTMTRVQLNVADMYGKNGMASAATGRSAVIDLSSTDNSARQNYIKVGGAYLLNQNAANASGKNSSSTTINGFTTANNFKDISITTVTTATQARTLSTQLLNAWRAANEWTKENGVVNPDDMVDLTYNQIEAIADNQGNVYLKNVVFKDIDSKADYFGGTISWDVVNITDSTVKTPASIGSYKIYWSRDGITPRQEVKGVTAENGVYSIPEGTKRPQNYDRYLLICATDGNGTELPVSAVIPLIDLAND